MSELHDKLMARGVASLSDCEVLALLLDDVAQSEELAQRILASCGDSLACLASQDISRLRMLEGVGLKRAQRLAVGAEWGRRCASAMAMDQFEITCSDDVVKLMRANMQSLDHEECWALHLNSQNRIVGQQCVARGGVSSATVDHRLIVKQALELLATRLVIVHNHPSGSADPSGDDVAMTQRIKSAAALFDIDLIDHLIISRDGDFSFLSADIL